MREGNLSEDTYARVDGDRHRSSQMLTSGRVEGDCSVRVAPPRGMPSPSCLFLNSECLMPIIAYLLVLPVNLPDAIGVDQGIDSRPTGTIKQHIVHFANRGRAVILDVTNRAERHAPMIIVVAVGILECRFRITKGLLLVIAGELV